MKETTKPKNTKQSHLLKRDLAVTIAVLPLPTPPAGARGEGRGSSMTTPQMEPPYVGCYYVMDEGSKLSPIDLQFPQFEEIASRRDEPLSLSQEILTLTTNYRLPNV